jgi:hypothetical protein
VGKKKQKYKTKKIEQTRKKKQIKRVLGNI